MKKFHFTLETVLRYKEQVLDSLLAKHAEALAQVRQQEALIERMEREYDEYNEDFCQKKSLGMNSREALLHENSLRAQEYRIRCEQKHLEELRAVEERCREEVVEARKENASLDKLREKKLKEHNHEMNKLDEQRIEEFVSSVRANTASENE